MRFLNSFSRGSKNAPAVRGALKLSGRSFENLLKSGRLLLPKKKKKDTIIGYAAEYSGEEHPSLQSTFQ